MADAAMHSTLYDMSALGFAAGDVVTVTGAGSGIGKATALAAAKSGLAVAAWDIAGEAAQNTVAEIADMGGKGLAIVANVGERSQVVAAWQATLALGNCRYLVNNAGPPSNDASSFGENLSRSLGAVELVTSTWLEHASDAAASVVNIASVAGNFQGAGLTVAPFYASAKAGITGYTRWLATKFGGKPRANVVAPGMTRTPRTIPFMENPAIAQSVTTIPMGRPGFPEELASAVLFLLSPAASYINGVLLPVDGGWVLS